MTFSDHISEALFGSPAPVTFDLCQAAAQDAHYDEINDATGTVPALPLLAFNLCTYPSLLLNAQGALSHPESFTLARFCAAAQNAETEA